MKTFRAVRALLILNAVLFTALSFHGSIAPAVANDSLNAVVIIADDQGWRDVSFNGNTSLGTPHIDQLAVSGATFCNFYIQPVCSPSRAEILTGQERYLIVPSCLLAARKS